MYDYAGKLQWRLSKILAKTWTRLIVNLCVMPRPRLKAGLICLANRMSRLFWM